MRVSFFAVCLASLVLCCCVPAGAASDAPPGTLRVAACQFPVSASITANAAWITRQMREAREKGADLAQFPECALSGYAGADYDSLETLDWDQLRRSTDEILTLAHELGLWVVLGSTHRLSGTHRPHNSLYLISPLGRIVDRYDKRFCTGGDLRHYSPGDHFVVFRVNGVTCGLLICFDVRFPELYREYSKQNVDVIFHSFYNAHERPGGIRPMIMPLTAQARAATNGMFVSLSNSSAPSSWPCYFITPDGRIGGVLPADEPGVLVSEIDTGRKYYDPSASFRKEVLAGKLNSGKLADDPRSRDRTGH